MKKIEYMYCIYKITNTKTNKLYIGATSNFDSRVKTHLNSLRRNKHHSIKLQRSYNKHSEEAFIFEIIQSNIPPDFIDTFEELWIKLYNSYNKGYNSTPHAHKHYFSIGNCKNSNIQVISYCISTGEVKQFQSITQAGRSAAVVIRNKTFIEKFDRLWFYAKDFNLENFTKLYKTYIEKYDLYKVKQAKRIIASRKICSYDLKSGNVEYFFNVYEPQSTLGYSNSYIQCLSNFSRNQKSAYNKLWFYTDEFNMTSFKNKYQNNLVKNKKVKTNFDSNPKIISYEINTGIVERFEYLTEPMKKYGYSGSYRQCLSGQTKRAFNKIWFYEGEFTLYNFIKKYKRLSYRKTPCGPKIQKVKQEQYARSIETRNCKYCNSVMPKYHKEKSGNRWIFRKDRLKQFCGVTCANKGKNM